MLQYFETLTDNSGNALLGATVLVQNYPALTNASIYSSNGTASPIANSTVTSDITGQISFYAPDGAYQLVYSYKSAVYKTKVPVQMIDPMGFVSATDTGLANAYVVTSSALPAQLYSGLKLEIRAANSNTGASTLNLNSTGTQPLVLPGGTALPVGVIQANGIFRVEWDGTSWEVIDSVGLFTQAGIGAVFLPPLAAEGATVVNPYYNYGDFRRYGGPDRRQRLHYRDPERDQRQCCRLRRQPFLYLQIHRHDQPDAGPDRRPAGRRAAAGQCPMGQQHPLP